MDKFEQVYQDSLLEFCRGKLGESIKIWEALAANDLAQAATRGKAAFSLAQSYSTGTGVAVDAEKALELFKSAAQFGHVTAALEAGRCMRYQLRDHPNTGFASTAVRFFTEAARAGSAEGHFELGLCHLQVMSRRRRWAT